MSLTSTAATLAAAGAEKLRELPMPAWVFGAVAFGSFVVLLGVLWTFRNTAAKYDTPIPVAQEARRAEHGSTDPGAHH